MSKWAEQQPRDGDVIVHCGHTDRSFHFWKTSRPVEVLRITAAGKSLILSSWIAACDDCFEKVEGDPDRLEIRAHGLWTGDAPSIVKSS